MDSVIDICLCLRVCTFSFARRIYICIYTCVYVCVRCVGSDVDTCGYGHSQDINVFYIFFFLSKFIIPLLTHGFCYFIFYFSLNLLSICLCMDSVILFLFFSKFIIPLVLHGYCYFYFFIFFPKLSSLCYCMDFVIFIDVCLRLQVYVRCGALNVHACNVDVDIHKISMSFYIY